MNCCVSTSKFALGSSNNIIFVWYKCAFAKNKSYLLPIDTSLSFKIELSFKDWELTNSSKLNSFKASMISSSVNSSNGSIFLRKVSSTKVGNYGINIMDLLINYKPIVLRSIWSTKI